MSRRPHRPNEYVIEGANGRYGMVYGLAEAEKSMTIILHKYAGKKQSRIPTQIFLEEKVRAHERGLPARLEEEAL